MVPVWCALLQLVFDGKTGRIYGAQAVGEHGIDKRIDVIAMAIQMKATVMDLTQAELCYSPQYGAAKDPVNIAGMVASNIVQGLTPLTPWEDVWASLDAPDTPEKIRVVDVRYCDEVAAEGELTAPDGRVVPCINVPLPQLRADAGCIDKLKAALPSPTTPVAVLCREGVRANSAVRLLRQHGIDARLLSGGYYTALLLRGLPFPKRVVSVDDDRFPHHEYPEGTLTGACCNTVHLPTGDEGAAKKPKTDA